MNQPSYIGLKRFLLKYLYTRKTIQLCPPQSSMRRQWATIFFQLSNYALEYWIPINSNSYLVTYQIRPLPPPAPFLTTLPPGPALTLIFQTLIAAPVELSSYSPNRIAIFFILMKFLSGTYIEAWSQNLPSSTSCAVFDTPATPEIINCAFLSW